MLPSLSSCIQSSGTSIGWCLPNILFCTFQESKELSWQHVHSNGITLTAMMHSPPNKLADGLATLSSSTSTANLMPACKFVQNATWLIATCFHCSLGLVNINNIDIVIPFAYKCNMFTSALTH